MSEQSPRTSDSEQSPGLLAEQLLTDSHTPVEALGGTAISSEIAEPVNGRAELEKVSPLTGVIVKRILEDYPNDNVFVEVITRQGSFGESSRYRPARTGEIHTVSREFLEELARTLGSSEATPEA